MKNPTSHKIYYSNSQKVPTNILVLSKYGINDTFSNVTFLGEGSVEYNGMFQQSFLSILENFSNSTAPTNVVEGQLWYDNINQELKVARVQTPYTPPVAANPPLIPNNIPARSEVIEWVSLGGPRYSSLPPTNTDILWFDTNTNLLKVYNGTEFIAVNDVVLSLSGDTMLGPLVVDGNLTVNTSTIKNTLLSTNTIQVNQDLVFGLDTTVTDGSSNILFSNSVASISSSNEIQLHANYTNTFVSSVTDLKIANASKVTISSSNVLLNETTTVGLVENLDTPVNPTDAARVIDLINTVASYGDTNLVTLQGDTITGTLNVSDVCTITTIQPSVDLELGNGGIRISKSSETFDANIRTTKQGDVYRGCISNAPTPLGNLNPTINTDSSIKLDLVHDSLTGISSIYFDPSEIYINNVSNPTESTDLVNKLTVDNKSVQLQNELTTLLNNNNNAKAWISVRNGIVVSSFNCIISTLVKTNIPANNWLEYKIQLADTTGVSSINDIAVIMSPVMQNSTNSTVVNSKDINSFRCLNQESFVTNVLTDYFLNVRFTEVYNFYFPSSVYGCTNFFNWQTRYPTIPNTLSVREMNFDLLVFWEA